MVEVESEERMPSRQTVDAALIQGALPSMFYIPNFISEEEESRIIQSIPPNKWIALSHRRLQAIPSRLTANNTLLASPLPSWLVHPIIDRFTDLGLFSDAPHGVNHCLINEYPPGQGIMPHEDGPAYHPVVATVSLDGTTVLNLTTKPEECDDAADTTTSTEPKKYRILQEPRSLLVTTGAAYTDTLHGIDDVSLDLDLSEETVVNWSLLGDRETIVNNGGQSERTTRISLTYRDVKKVSKVGQNIFGKGRR